ncbi:MAG: hypothetical protein KME21_14755 [Desmonostoc vinosum HA7617-LM4]|nr:hypothetical protein [Desmonostoc vinosum HA7617-LM4]
MSFVIDYSPRPRVPASPSSPSSPVPFGAMMQVTIENDGPATLILER